MTVLSNTLLLAQVEAPQSGTSIALQLPISLLEQLPKWLLRSCKKLPMSPFPNTPEDTLLQINCTEVHEKERNPCLTPASFHCKS